MSRGYLLDTSVLSVLAPGRQPLGAEQEKWLRAQADQLFVSAITVVEVEQGIHKVRRSGGIDRAARLAAWLDGVLAFYGDRVIPVDTPVARIAGRLSDQAFAAGRHPGLADIAIAATALAHDLVVLTQNGKHFEPLGVANSDVAAAAHSG